MSCPFPVVGYQPPPPGFQGKCCNTATAIKDWLVNNSNGNFYYNGCYGYKKIQGTKTPSVHGTGRAIDISVRNARVGSGQNNMMTALIDNYLMQRPCTLGIQRMIWQRKIWDATDPNVPWANWRTFTGTQSHNDHLHLEITPAKCSQFRYPDVVAVFQTVGPPSVVLPNGGSYPKDPELPPTAPTPVVNDPTPADTNTGSDTGTGGGDGTTAPPATPPTSDTGPVWNPAIKPLSPCTACGGVFANLNSNPEDGDVTALTFTHCGGTGAICIRMETGETCSTGTAPVIGNFPGPIKDFIWWGNGAYGLSQDGTTVWAMGGAQVPVFELRPPNMIPPWDYIYAVNPDTIALAGQNALGSKYAVAKVNSVASYTCC